MGYSGGSGSGSSGGSAGSAGAAGAAGGAGGGGGYRSVGGGSAFGDVSGQELPSLNQAPAGSIRFNTDSKKLEVYILGPVGFGTVPNGIWMEVDSWSPELQTGGTRGLTGGGATPNKQDRIDYINIATTGDAIDFGNLSESRYWLSSFSSSTRGIWGGGGVHPTSPNKTDRIDFVTIASTGDATDFGNLVEARYGMGGCSNQTRGLFGGGYQTPNNDMVNFVDYITIASAGDAKDFGDLSVTRMYLTAASSSTRGLFLSGRTGTGPWTYYDTIDYVNLSTQGNAADFGNLLSTAAAGQSTSNSTRAIYASSESPANNTIQYVTISTNGNAQDFGDLNANQQQGSATASPTRGVIAGGYISAYVDNIEYVQIMSTGNAIDFGNLSLARGNNASCSNGHGGL